ncbi:MAG: beta-lactamase family protein [Gemmatimonadota bacterium]|nr:MAG: beta-lactamase family protein [Gemmatimonadota bacterium]
MFVLLLLTFFAFTQIDTQNVSCSERDGSVHPRVAFVSEIESTSVVPESIPSIEDISKFSDSPITVLTPEALDAFILQIMETHHIPGVSALVVYDGRVAWSGAYGFANVTSNIQTSDSTVFMLASVSKTVTGAALLQLWEEGMFELDDDVNDYLPFTVVNPNHPDDAITFRMLLAHTSSLRDNWDVMFSTYVRGDTPIPLDEYVRDYFVPGGVYYDASENFNIWAPGTKWQYCNHGFVLAGYLVEAITGIPFEEYCQDSLFSPLGMNETSWFLEGLDRNTVAMPYHYTHNQFVPYGHFGYADYPAGALRSSTVQLARFLVALLHKGRIDGAKILDSTTVELMTTIQYPTLYPTQGLIWFQRTLGEKVLWNHGGGDQGVSTIIAF